MCKELGNEPDASQIPIESDDFSPDIQIALIIHNILDSQFETTGGYYIGKDYTLLQELLTSYDIIESSNRLYIIGIIKQIDTIVMKIHNDKQEATNKRLSKNNA